MENEIRVEENMSVSDKLVCKICGREYKNIKSLSGHIISHNIFKKEYYDKYLKKDNNEGICLQCGKETDFYNLRLGYHKFCSYECSALNLQVKDKKIKTNLKKYGFKSSNQSIIVKEKKILTSQKNCGKDYWAQTNEGKEKLGSIMLKKYGKKYVFQLEKFREKSKQTSLNNHGFDNYSKTHEFRELARLKMKEKRESQLQKGQELDYKEGKYERVISDELLLHTNEIFLRKQWFGGLNPDLIGKNILAIVEIDEKYHFSRQCYIEHDRIKNEYYISKGYIPIHIKESDWFEDKELQIIKFLETIKFLKQVEQIK